MHHVFSVEIATEYGINAAVVLQNLEYWIAHNKANEKHFYEGRYWTYSSVRALEELFPYLSGRQISTALQKLMDGGVIIRGRFNKYGMDRTLWYALTDKGEALLGHRATTNSNQAPEPDENPFGDYSDSGIPDTAESYAAQNLDQLAPGNMQEFAVYKATLSDDVIKHAIDEACANGVRTWSYVRKILMKYSERGLNTLDKVMAAERSNARNRPKNAPEDDNPLLKAKFY